jgi:transposase
VESTYNWYWLVDGLMEADWEHYRIVPARPATFSLTYTSYRHHLTFLEYLKPQCKQ